MDKSNVATLCEKRAKSFPINMFSLTIKVLFTVLTIMQLKTKIVYCKQEFQMLIHQNLQNVRNENIKNRLTFYDFKYL